MSFYCELELLYENLDYTSGVGPGINLFPEVWCIAEGRDVIRGGREQSGMDHKTL